MDGFSVCSKIRENGNTPIIIVSARGSKEDAKRSYAGC